MESKDNVIKLRAGDTAYVRRGDPSSWDRRHFSKAYETAWQAVFYRRVFTPQETHALLFLGSYCEAESNAVVGAHGAMRTREIADGLHWSERNAKRILSSLQSKNAIFYGGGRGAERYFVNPALFGRGGVSNATTRRMFEDRKDQLMQDASGMLSFLRVGRNDSTIVDPT